MNEEDVLRQWLELKTMVEILDIDVTKNANGNVSAGIRARRGLRELRAVTSALIMTTLKAQKTRAAKK